MVSYPTETVIAGTWNVPLTYELGKSFGEEGLWGGGVGWYGPAANIHRTPFGGRNFEYFSEDGFISGKLAESEVQGAMSKGTIPYLKHFFGNDQETNRIGVCTFMNEQSTCVHSNMHLKQLARMINHAVVLWVLSIV